MAEPVRLTELLSDISNLYSTLRAMPDKRSVTALGERLRALRKLVLDDILKTLDIVNSSGEIDENKTRLWDTMLPAWKLERIKRVDEKVVLEESAELSEFFSNVSNAVIDAQKNLNAFSKTYVEQLTDKRVQPTYFAIPTVKAEMKLGFSELTQRGINVILFKSEEQRKRYVESTITFELASTPPVTTAPPSPDPPPPPKRLPPPGPGGPADFVPELLELAPAEAAESETPRREEEIPEGLSETLSGARDALFAATDRLVEARAIFEARAAAAGERAETPVVAGAERMDVLNLIAAEHREAGERAAAADPSRAEALVLKYRRGGADRYLVIWPSRPEDPLESEWNEVRVYDVAAGEGGPGLAAGAFGHAPAEKYLTVGSKSQLLKLKKDELAQLALALGDALTAVTAVFAPHDRPYVADDGSGLDPTLARLAYRTLGNAANIKHRRCEIAQNAGRLGVRRRD